jgi:long-subunit acyl-CoA synthetase (AMP-forming)
LVYNRVKAALGLDACRLFAFGSAPLDPAIRKYFFSLNIFLRNGYGMTECTAPESATDPNLLSPQQ